MKNLIIRLKRQIQYSIEINVAKKLQIQLLKQINWILLGMFLCIGTGILLGYYLHNEDRFWQFIKFFASWIL